jgi:hypothetical protein
MILRHRHAKRSQGITEWHGLQYVDIKCLCNSFVMTCILRNRNEFGTPESRCAEGTDRTEKAMFKPSRHGAQEARRALRRHCSSFEGTGQASCRRHSVQKAWRHCALCFLASFEDMQQTGGTSGRVPFLYGIRKLAWRLLNLSLCLCVNGV